MFYCLAAVAEIRQSAAFRGEQTEKEKPEGFSGIEVIMELCLEQVGKSFQDNRAVDDVSLRITPGVWGLLGANGAGKTTLMRMIAGILKPDKGRITYDGIRIDSLGEAYRDIFGYLPQEFGFYPEFTVRDYLEYMAALKGLKPGWSRRKIGELLETLTLEEVKNKKIVRLSGGMKRRVGIAQALLNEPEILILDEPTSGLDPGERVRFRNLLSEFAHDRIVLISTHIVPDVEYIAMKNAVMKDGKIIETGTTPELVKRMEGKVFSEKIPARALADYEKKLCIVNLKMSRTAILPFVIWETDRKRRILFRRNPGWRICISGFSPRIQMDGKQKREVPKGGKEDEIIQAGIKKGYKDTDNLDSSCGGPSFICTDGLAAGDF